MSCHLSAHPEEEGIPRRFRIVDKHGLSRHAYNLELSIDLEGSHLKLGLDADRLPGRGDSAALAAAPVAESSNTPATAEEMFDDLASLLHKRSAKRIVED
jgi:hypothetical protein